MTDSQPVQVHPRQTITKEDLDELLETLAAQQLQTIQLAATVRPGDTLILSLQPNVTLAQADRMRALFEDKVPNVTVVFVSGVDSITVHHAE